MRKIDLILSAMLVSYAMSPTAIAADDAECILQRQEPVLDTSMPSSATVNTLQPEAVSRTRPATGLSGRTDRDSQGEGTTAGASRQIVAFTPQTTRENLFNVLSGWSSVIKVEFVSPLSTKSARVGDVVETKLAQDFRWGPQLIAAKDSLVRGHVTEVDSARTLTSSALSSERRLKSRGRLSVQFDEIVDQTGYRWPIQATPSPGQKTTQRINRSSVRYVEADAGGRIVKAEAGLAGGLRVTSDAAKVVSLVPVPSTILLGALTPAVAMGAVGAASPSIAYDKPVDSNTENRRTKGAAYGFFSYLPGAGVVKAVVEKGSEIAIIPGDQLTLNVCIKRTGFSLPPGRQATVNGNVINSSPINRLYPASYGQPGQ